MSPQILYLYGDIVYGVYGGIAMSRERLEYLQDSGKAVNVGKDDECTVFEERPASLQESYTLRRTLLTRLTYLDTHPKTITTNTYDLNDQQYLEKRLETLNETIQTKREKIMQDITLLDNVIRKEPSIDRRWQLGFYRTELLLSMADPTDVNVSYAMQGTNGTHTKMTPVVTIGNVTQRGNVFVPYLGYIVLSFIIGALAALMAGCTPYF